MSELSCIILAAGRSTRFPAPQGKLFYPLVGQPVIAHLLHTVSACPFSQIVIVANEHNLPYFEALRQQFSFEIVVQEQQDGTWGALQVALPIVKTTKCVLINGDQPLVPRELLERLFQISHKDFALVSMILSQPHGYGRIVRNADGQWVDLVEEKDLAADQKSIQEVNAGIYLLPVALLKNIEIAPSVVTGERYLTQIWGKNGFCDQTELIIAQRAQDLQGINTWADFEQVEQYYYLRQREKLVAQGVILQNCSSIIIENADFIKAAPGVLMMGPLHIDGPLVCEPLVELKPFTTVSAGPSYFGAQSQIGPYAFIQTGVQTAQKVHLGSFVEAKRCQIGAGTKAKHFSYIADASIGESNNIGAFVVFCNYDGLKKHRCLLGSHVFVGSSSQLIAPVVIGDHSYIGAGTTVTHNVAPQRLITRRAPWRDRAVKKGEELCVESSAASDLT